MKQGQGEEHFGGAIEDARLEAGDTCEEIAVMGDRGQVGRYEWRKVIGLY